MKAAMEAVALTDEQIENARREEERAEADRAARLEGLGAAIAEKRAEAISARALSGIEEEWTADEEYYEGIDDASRGDSAWSTKPPGRSMPADEDTGSTIFLNITRPYCDAAGASLADMLLPTDDSAWQIIPTPVPELVPIAEGEVNDDIRRAILTDTGGDEQAAAAIEAKVISQAQKQLEEANGKAEKAQMRIEDWMVECQFHAELRKVIEGTAIVGSGVLKGPVPQRRRQVAYTEGALIIAEEVKPGSRCISHWSLFPDGACGENIHNGSYIFEKDDITERQLRDLIGADGYIESQIKAVLEEGATEAGKTYQNDVQDMRRRDIKGLYEIWYFHGDLSKDDLRAVFDSAGYDCGCDLDEVDVETIAAQVVMVNNRIIKATLNTLDTGEFPYDVMIWQRRKGMPWGIGVSSQIRTPQRMINGAARNLMDNAGLAGGPMWAFKSGLIEPIDGVYGLSPRKGWMAAEDADLDDISRALTYFKLDMMVEELQSIIYLGLKMAEDVTGLPMIMQGQMGSQKLDTLGQTQLLQNNANIVRRRLARLFDDLVTEPHVRRYYTYLLQYGEDAEKGDFTIDARGSSNLVERAIQKEKTFDLLNLAMNPIYNLDPKKVAKEYLRSEKFDPKNFEYDDEEWKALVEKMSQPAADPRTEVAQIRAQVDAAIAKLRADSSERITVAKLDADALEQDKQHQFEAALEQFTGQLTKEIQEMKYRGDKDIQFDELKTRLNETVMKLATQTKLSAAGARAKDMTTPPTEPAGLAPPGQSYQK